MKTLSIKPTFATVNGQVISDEPSYLYEIIQNGPLTSRHNMVLNTIMGALKNKGFSLEESVLMNGHSFHNVTIATFGPVIVNSVGEMVYTFRPDRTMVKLDYGMTQPANAHHILQQRGMYVCPSSAKAADGSSNFVEYLAVLNSGAIRLSNAAQPNALRFTVLSKKPIPDEIKKHLFNEKGEQTTEGLKSTNNPAIGFKLLLDLLDEVDVNGDKVSG